MTEFLSEFNLALERARKTVLDRQSRNQIVSIPDMFPHGIQDILFMIYMKICRALGEDSVGNRELVLEELEDIINYSAFGIALNSLETHENINPTPDPKFESRR